MGRQQKDVMQNRVECGMKVEGTAPGLGDRWTHGVATLGPGVITLIPFIGGVRFLRRAPIRVQVERVDASGDQSTKASEAWSVRPGFPVVQVYSASGVLDWTMPSEQLEWAIRTVTESRS